MSYPPLGVRSLPPPLPELPWHPDPLPPNLPAYPVLYIRCQEAEDRIRTLERMLQLKQTRLAENGNVQCPRCTGFFRLDVSDLERAKTQLDEILRKQASQRAKRREAAHLRRAIPLPKPLPAYRLRGEKRKK